MAKIKSATDFNKALVPFFLQVGRPSYHVDYDEEVDVLYVSFRKPQCADDSVMDDDFIYHYDGKRLVGVTILNASGKTIVK